ncbi:hypothetical protein P9222_22050 [Paenibacillus amylolyticus]|nr:hypothetical protein [Paenibacillus amylolyticus]WFR61150.1 hypothetical protein P9222_22050 [Paenibacillus amylolyticus]
MRAKLNAKAQEIDFIIVNQDLLIRDLMKKEGTKRIISEQPALIVIDEAHNLETKVRDARTLEFTYREYAAFWITRCSFSPCSPGIRGSFHNPILLKNVPSIYSNR